MKRRPLNLIHLEVTGEDIEEMYERYDSGMADHTTANAVSLALKRKLKPGYTPRIVSASRHRACQLEVDNETFPLPGAVFWWLDRTGKGTDVSATAFSLVLPEDIIRVDEPGPENAGRGIAA